MIVEKNQIFINIMIISLFLDEIILSLNIMGKNLKYGLKN